MVKLRGKWAGRMTRAGVAMGMVLLVSACGGGTQAAPPAPPTPAPRSRPAPADTQAIPIVRTDTARGQLIQPKVFGVDLDTVHAGRFDQGKMWTFEFPPTDYFAQTYGFRPDSAWFAHARLGALRIPSCSASFVSPNGLVMTNHHCAREFVTQVQKDGEHLLDDGFEAKTLADERAVKDFKADQLIDIVDVTDEVNRQLDQVPLEQRSEQRDTILEHIKQRITKERGGEEAHIAVDMVSLYDGARTSAYVFHRYTDVKLVMVPEVQIGFFGGDPDNFTYPRYNLDFSFFRVYGDDGKPLKTPDYFHVDTGGIHEGEPIFVVGNPGSTSRLQTVAELEFRRDVGDVDIVKLLRSRMEVLDSYIKGHPQEAEARDLRNSYFELSNSEKAYTGQVKGLEDPVIIARRQDTENKFQSAIEADSALAGKYGDLIQRMAKLQTQKRQQAGGFGAFLALTSDEMASATLHRALLVFQILSMQAGGVPDEQTKELVAQLDSVPQQDADLDEALMVARFKDFVTYYGEDSPLAKAVLRGRTPEEVAKAVHEQSVLADSAGAVQAVTAKTVQMTDAALQIVRGYLPTFVQFQRVVSDVFPQEEGIAAELGRARFALYGTAVPPDATFSLRIADGVVKGYPYNGTVAPWFTTFYGLYDRHFSFPDRDDWALPDRWKTPPAGLDLSTPLDFVSTADIIGGNSGSPVLDKDLDIVGLIFDGNIESLPGDYIYMPAVNRAVAVDIRGILAALTHVYGMNRVATELTTGRLGS